MTCLYNNLQFQILLSNSNPRLHWNRRLSFLSSTLLYPSQVSFVIFFNLILHSPSISSSLYSFLSPPLSPDQKCLWLSFIQKCLWPSTPHLLLISSFLILFFITTIYNTKISNVFSLQKTGNVEDFRS
jgi:hypothetical protein